MKKPTQILLICIGLLDIIAAAFVTNYFFPGKEVLFTVIPGMFVFNFFMYKLLTGWLIVNMNIKLEATRLPILPDKEKDHLALKVTLTKGSIDSIWMDRIEIRLSEISGENATGSQITKELLKPVNTIKLGDEDGDYWNGPRSDFYTVSSGEEAVFSAYTAVPKNIVIVAELLVLGTRLFYGIETSRDKRIQWRSSIIILPAEVRPGAPGTV
jgi:hypothetical protein